MKRSIWIAGGVGLLLVLGLWWWLSSSAKAPSGDPAESGGNTATSELVDASEEPRETKPIELFFPSGAGLVPESFEVSANATVEQQLMEVLTGLVSGPQNKSLQAPLPEGVKAGAVFLIEKTAYVDLVSSDAAPFPTTGSQREMLTAYSLVQSLAGNFDEVESVVLLLNGRQPTTLAGHLDTTRPLRERPEWVQR